MFCRTFWTWVSTHHKSPEDAHCIQRPSIWLSLSFCLSACPSLSIIRYLFCPSMLMFVDRDWKKHRKEIIRHMLEYSPILTLHAAVVQSTRSSAPWKPHFEKPGFPLLSSLLELRFSKWGPRTPGGPRRVARGSVKSLLLQHKHTGIYGKKIAPVVITPVGVTLNQWTLGFYITSNSLRLYLHISHLNN